jgi:hypothetical protein
MFRWIVVTLLAGAPPADSDAPIVLAQLTIQQRVIIRVPTQPPAIVPPVRWRERDGPKCIEASTLAGAQVSPDGVDLLLRGGSRLRAKLASECPALNYYSGFYIRPGRDGRVCADRDTIRTRAGGQCEIDRFRSLVPEKPKRRK